MKKFSFVLMLGVALTLFSCGGGSNAKLENRNDSLSYAMSLAKTDGLSEVMYQQLGVDSACVEDFLRGVKDAFSTSDDAKSKAYQAGLQIGMQAQRVCESANTEAYADDTIKSLNKALFLAGLVAGVKGDSSKMSMTQGKDYYLNIVYKEPNETFMTENAKQPGITVTPDGLQYQIITAAADDAQKPALTDSVKCIYTGTLYNGRTFDSSRGQEATFAVNAVIPGWTEALQMMGKGAKWKLFIPAALGYGENGNQRIPPYSSLVFEIELKDIVKAKAAPAKK